MLKKLTLIFVALFILGLSACDSKPKTSTEKMKESVHKAVEATKEAAHDTERATKEAVHDIKKDMK